MIFPDAIKQKLIEIAPPDYEAVKRLDLGYDDGTESQSKPKTPYDSLWPQQRLAIGAWYNPSKWQENLASNQTDEAKTLSDFLKKQSSVQPVTQNRAFQGILVHGNRCWENSCRSSGCSSSDKKRHNYNCNALAN